MDDSTMCEHEMDGSKDCRKLLSVCVHNYLPPPSLLTRKTISTVQRNYLFHRSSSEVSMPARSRVTQNARAAGGRERPLNRRVLDSRP